MSMELQESCPLSTIRVLKGEEGSMFADILPMCTAMYSRIIHTIHNYLSTVSILLQLT